MIRCTYEASPGVRCQRSAHKGAFCKAHRKRAGIPASALAFVMKQVRGSDYVRNDAMSGRSYEDAWS